MRPMVLVRATEDSEAGVMPSEQLLAEIQTKSKEEAIEWVKRCPNPHDEGGEIEIRQVFEAEGFGEGLTPELREQEECIRTEAEGNQ